MDNGTLHRIRFPESLKVALRDGRLVVFTGAGVSMGEPACLPDFPLLACRIAEGTGDTLAEGEPADQFLGRLQKKGVQVHALAAEALSGDDLAPTPLHRDLLELYPDVDQVRIVTTNFDLLFEKAAKSLLPTAPEMFRAPALPLGHDFTGIVHVHGAVSRPKDMVLTDADFGRAYLTEGWARRFLTGLFREFAVLFVGYSHNDTIMNYLARALPESQFGERFALTSQRNDDPQRWRVLGVEPISYAQASDHDHSLLYQEVRRLAAYTSRGVLDWQREITELAAKPPPINDVDIETIEEALKDPVKTRFFAKAACLPEWIGWLNARNQLDALFSHGDLGERDKILAEWLAKQFAHDHADELFLLVAQHRMYLHPYFWHELGRKIGLNEQDLTNKKKEAFSRWISLLIATVPGNQDGHVMLRLGQRCIKHGMVDDLVSIFDAMAEGRLVLKPALVLPDVNRYGTQSPVRVETNLGGDHYTLNELWEGLKPGLAQVAEPLLKRISRRLEEQHLQLRAWQAAGPEWDPASFGRSAIEPHEQDKYPGPIDVLIDTARDCLEWLVDNDKCTAARCCDELAGSEVPLLRRLAVHTLHARQDLVPAEKLDWLLTHVQIHDIVAHHEIFCVAQQAYSEADQGRRRIFIETVLAYRWPNEDDSDKGMHTARHHFDWLDWLHKSAPECKLARHELDRVAARYPEWKSREHPDFTHWTGKGEVVSHQSPWSVDELLTRSPREWLPRLLSFEQKEFDGPNRIGLSSAVEAAARRNFDWGLGLVDQLAGTEEWGSDLWPALMRAWSTTELGQNRHRAVLNRLGSAELYGKQGGSIADALYALVKDGRESYAKNLLSQANAIAFGLWPHLEQEDPPEESDDWLTKAINHPAGKLALYWLHSLSIWRSQKDPDSEALSEEHRAALSQIVHDRSLSGRLGRAVLASQFSFLVAVDKEWTQENVLALFYAGDDMADFQAVWHGFLTQGRLRPIVAELLSQAFFEAVPRIVAELSSQRDRFVEYYVVMIGYFIDEPLRKWIPRLFEHADDEVRKIFAMNVWRRLQSMDDVQRLKQWKRWLGPYWKGRLQGKPKPLEPTEVEIMIQWLPSLTAVFSEAVELALGMPPVPSHHGMLIHDIKEKEIWKEHPEEVARLLIHLGNSGSPRYSWHRGRELIENLLGTDLSSERKRGLKELIVKLNLTRGVL